MTEAAYADPSCGFGDVRDVVAALRSWARGGSVASADARQVALLVDGLRAVEREVAVLGLQITDRMAVLSANGEAAGPIETLLAGGRQVSGRQARREAARSDLVAWWPEIGEALVEGRISPATVDALARQTDRLTTTQRGRLPRGELLAEAERLPVDTFARSLGRVIACIETEGDDAIDKRARSSVRHWFDHGTGMGHIAGTFDPERYEGIVNAIEQRLRTLAATDPDAGEKGPRLAADSVHELITGAGPQRPGRAHITVVIGPDGHAETGDGHPITPVALQRLRCDAVIQRVLLDEEGVPINVGRTLRTATAAQWTAIRSLHRTCAWPGCTQPLSRCQLHHIHEWRHGGRTDLANLLPLCTHHHHLVHEGRWQVELGPDRALVVVAPDGRRSPPTPSPGRSSHLAASGTEP